MLTTIMGGIARLDIGLASYDQGALSLIPNGTVGLPAIIGVLAVLALADSMSFGTLLIPVWLLIAPGRLRAGRFLLYLLVVGAAYSLIGLLILTMLHAFGDKLFAWIDGASATPIFLAVQLTVGAALLWLSFRLDPMTKAGKERKRAREAASVSGGRRTTAERLQQFRQRAVGQDTASGIGPLVGLALAAVGLEIATLLPYLAGIGLVAATEQSFPTAPLLILFYCLVMLTPALVLFAGRILARNTLEGPLQKLEAFMSRHTNGALGWVVGIIGVLLSLNALGKIGLI